MMKTCLVKQGNTEEDGDEGVKDLIEMTLRKMDHDKDGRVSYPDFQITVKYREFFKCRLSFDRVLQQRSPDDGGIWPLSAQL